MIKLENIYLKYNEKNVFNGFSIKIAEGEKVVILGKSGVGKSSVFSLILGFAHPEKGDIFFDGTRVDEKTVWNVREKIAFVDQDVSLGIGKVAAWIDFVAGLKANSSFDFSRDLVNELLDFFELGIDSLEKDVSDLSGGERQRVAIIISVLLQRKIFFLDEATSALDKNLKQKVVNFFAGNKDWTVAAVSHDAVWLNHSSVKVFDLEAHKWKL